MSLGNLKFGTFDQEKAIYATTAPRGKKFFQNKMKEFAWLESQYNSLGLTKLCTLRELLETLLIAITESPIEGGGHLMSYNKDDTPAVSLDEYLQSGPDLNYCTSTRPLICKVLQKGPPGKRSDIRTSK